MNNASLHIVIFCILSEGMIGMAKKTNYVSNGKECYRIRATVGKKLDKHGIWVDDVKAFYGSCKSEAEQKQMEYMKKMDQGSLSDEYLGILMDKWIEEVFKVSDYANSTKRKYIAAYKKVLRSSRPAGMRICEVNAFHIQSVYNNSDVCESTLRAANNLLKLFYKYAELNSICRDITNSVTVPKKNDEVKNSDKIEVWDDDDLKKVIAALEGSTLRLLIVLAVNTGARFAELLALTYDDILNDTLYINKQLSEVSKIDNEDVKLHITETKTPNSVRAIPLSKAVMDEVEQHKLLHKTEMMANGYRTNNVFTTSHGTYYYKRNISRSIVRLCKRIGATYHKFHAFRHTFGTNLSRAGVPIEETSKLMGHKDISITAKYYVNVDADRRRDAVEKIVDYSLSV